MNLYMLVFGLNNYENNVNHSIYKSLCYKRGIHTVLLFQKGRKGPSVQAEGCKLFKGQQVFKYTRKITALLAAFSNFCGGLQPSASTVGPFGPN